jgi:polar amino acid transport system substrate-binding protein
MRDKPTRQRPDRLAAGALVLSLVAAACGASGRGASPAPAGGGTGGDASPSSAGAEQSAAPLNHLLPDTIRQSGVVRVGTDATYPPYEFAAEGSQDLQGFDVDLGNALGDVLGVRLEFSNLAFDGLIPAVEAGRYDLIIAGMNDLPERQAKVDFVDYQRGGFSILVKKGNPLTIDAIEDLCGRTVAVQKGTAQVDLVKEQSAKCDAPITVLEFPLESDAQLAVQSGRADADVADTAPLGYVAKTVGAGNTFELAPTPQYEATALIGIAVKKDLPELRDAVQAALQKLMDDGTYATILEKWGLSPLALDKATINAGT